MIFIQIFQTLCLLILIDREFILRKKYKIAFEYSNTSYHKYFAVWIYCKMPQSDCYSRNGGKRLFFIEIIK